MMMNAPKVSAKKNPGLQDDHDPSDIGQRTANKPKQQQSQMEGPAAYAPHDEGEKKGQKPSDATKQKPDTPPDADSLGGRSQGGM
jgi:hypothetical protein